MATSIAGYGVVLKRATVTIAKVTKISGVDISHDILDTTSHDSASGYKESIQGLLDAGDVTVEADYVPADAGQSALIGDAQSLPGAAATAWTLQHTASGLTWAFNANVKNLKINMELAGKVTLSFDLAITGAPTLTH
jgi:predicted secreted protein